MASLTRQVFSGSSDGRPVKVAATGTLGTTVHTADATAKDEVWLFAVNRDTQDRTLTIEFGGATSPDHLVTITLSPNEPQTVIPGATLTNSRVVTAFCAAAANVISVYGHVNRYS